MQGSVSGERSVPDPDGQWLIAKTNSFWVLLAEGVNTPKKGMDSISKRQHKSFQILLFISVTFPLDIAHRERREILRGNGQREVTSISVFARTDLGILSVC